MNNYKILVMIPAYNEEENIEKVVNNVKDHFPQADILVINDCSTDSTELLLRKNGIPYISFTNNLGIGGGVQAGYLYADKKGYDIAIQFDGDGQHPAEELPLLIDPIIKDKADYVIGSRFIENKGFQSSLARRLGIRFLSGIIRLLCKVKIYDVTSGMRAVNKKVIHRFAYEYTQDYPEPEAIVSASMMNARIIEIPVQMRERQGGKSSINIIRSIYYMIKVTIALFVTRINTKMDKGIV